MANVLVTMTAHSRCDARETRSMKSRKNSYTVDSTHAHSKRTRADKVQEYRVQTTLRRQMQYTL